MRPHAFAYKMCADFPAPVSTDRPIVLGWAARSLATGISWYGTRAASGAGVSSYHKCIRPKNQALQESSLLTFQWQHKASNARCIALFLERERGYELCLMRRRRDYRLVFAVCAVDHTDQHEYHQSLRYKV